MTRERDAQTPNPSEGDLTPSLERAFHTTRPASIAIFDITGNGSIDPRQSMWSLANKYAPLFGSKGELTVRPRRDLYDFSARYDEELREFGEDGESDDAWRMQHIRKSEAEFMAGLLFSPPTDILQTQQRQVLLEQLAASEQLDDLIQLKNASYRVLVGTWNLVADPGNSRFDDRGLLQRFNDGDKVVRIFEDEYSHEVVEELEIAPMIEEAVGAINQGSNSLQKLVDVLNTQADPSLKGLLAEIPQTFTAIKSELGQFAPLDDSHRGFVSWELYDKYNSLYGYLNRRLEPYFFQIGAALEFAKKIRDEGWGKVSFDPDKPIGYQQGWNLEKSKGRQVLNDSPDDAPIVLLSGANTSGKSFAMKSDFLIRIAGQSLGFAPAQAANLRSYESFIYLDRSATDSSNDLSAFMREVQNWKTALPAIGANSRLYVDEGYSTTSPQDQARLLFATAEYVKRNGGSVMLATHNDMVLDAAAGNQDMHIYHLAAEVGANGELVRHFRLQPGRSESLSFAVARIKDFPSAALNWAEAYLRREPVLPIPIVAGEYPAIEQFTGEERERRKTDTHSLEHLFPARPINPVFRLLSIDPDFQIERFFQHATHSREEKMMDFLSIGTQKELLAKMVVWTPELSSAEILERQRMVGELLGEGMQQKIHDAIAQATALDGTFASLKRAAKEGLNQGLNPFQERRSERRSSWRVEEEPSDPPFSNEGLQAAIAFLKIQQKVSGNDFQFAHMLSQFTSLASIYEQASQRTGEDGVRKTTELTEDEKILLLLSTEGEQREVIADAPATIEHLEGAVEKLFGKLRAASKDLPIIPFESIKIDEIKDELAALKNHTGAAAALEELPENIDKARSLIDLLRTVDSVYLHQTANFLEQQIDRNVAILKGETEEETETTDETSHDNRTRQFDHIGRRGFSVFGLMNEGRGRERSLYGETLQQLDALCLFADIAQQEGFTPVQFNATGEVEIRDGFSVFKKKRDEVKNTLTLNAGDERIQLLTGPNGSGKTFYEKGSVAAVLMGLATGYAPAEYASMPVFDGVVYLDRVVERQNDEFSAFSQEVEYWKQLMPLLDSKKAVFAAVDEAFSTTSPSYQAAFTFGVVSEFLQSPHFLLLSTHNHDVVNHLEGSQVPMVSPYHFQFSTENGRVQYQYKLQKGHETSHAVEVARTMGLPDEITGSTSGGA